jgi:hypothetical protein
VRLTDNEQEALRALESIGGSATFSNWRRAAKGNDDGLMHRETFRRAIQGPQNKDYVGHDDPRYFIKQGSHPQSHDGHSD